MQRQPSFQSLLENVPRNGFVLDVGCGDASRTTANTSIRPDIKHHGCDKIPPNTVEGNYSFSMCDLEAGYLPYGSDRFDVVFICHVLEHISNPILIIGECIRVLKPGGFLYIEAPSDRSLMISWPFSQNWNLILSFYDDPTHLGRPWTPQSFYRIAKYYDVISVASKYDTSLLKFLKMPFKIFWGILTKQPDLIVSGWWEGIGWTTYSIMRKPLGMSGSAKFRYFSLKNHPISTRYEAKF